MDILFLSAGQFKSLNIKFTDAVMSNDPLNFILTPIFSVFVNVIVFGCKAYLF